MCCNVVFIRISLHKFDIVAVEQKCVWTLKSQGRIPHFLQHQSSTPPSPLSLRGAAPSLTIPCCFAIPLQTEHSALALLVGHADLRAACCT